jgi:prephenate dehydratase
VRVAIQGEAGAFSHQAALQALGREVEIHPCASFEALFAAAVSGVVARAVVPIENSLFGSLHENYDRLWSSPLAIVAELSLRVRHCLVARPGAALERIRRVASHPVALAQCRNFLAAHPELEAVAADDTAASVRRLMQSGGDDGAAIASRLAADLYGGTVLAEGVEDDPQNFTRFLVLARDAEPVAGANKTSLVFTLPNTPGSLHGALGSFARRGLDLAKIESRPLRGRPWEYAFYLDVIGDPRGALAEALAELRALAPELRVLGSYPEALGRTAAGPAA